MAKRVLLVDDLTGDVIDEGLGGTVEFSFEGKHYSIDLGVKNQDVFRETMKHYIDHAEEVEAPRQTHHGRPRGASTKRPETGSGRSKEELANIRDWLKRNDHEVSPRGRIKAELLAIYDEAHQ